MTGMSPIGGFVSIQTVGTVGTVLSTVGTLMSTIGAILTVCGR